MVHKRRDSNKVFVPNMSSDEIEEVYSSVIGAFSDWDSYYIPRQEVIKRATMFARDDMLRKYEIDW